MCINNTFDFISKSTLRHIDFKWYSITLSQYTYYCEVYKYSFYNRYNVVYNIA